MLAALNRPFSRLSFSRQFLLLSVLILVGGTLTIGLWLERQLETSAANRAAAITALYVDGILEAQLLERSAAGALTQETRESLDRLFVQGPLHHKVVRFKLWNPDGTVLYSSDHGQEGLRFPVTGHLAAALAGEMKSAMSILDEPQEIMEREHWPRLLEVYVPVHGKDGRVTAVAEFYHSVENLGREIRAAQRRGWVLVVAGVAATYLLLLGLVRRASNTILGQRNDLRRKLDDLRLALDENERMRERLREAGARTTALNEQFLQRVAADLHDGPAQDMALALLRFETLVQACNPCRLNAGGDVRTIHKALQSSLEELRAIASGLRMPPGTESLSLADMARRAVRDFERKSGATVETAIDATPGEASLALKITVYRLIQEALTNGWWHARGSAQRVRVGQEDGEVLVEVADQGPGFDPQSASSAGRLGLTFMHERARLLGGVLEVDAAPGRGTLVRARLPLTTDEVANA